MPAVSKKQQEFMAIAEHEPEKLRGKAPQMTQRQLHDFAATPRKGLPEQAKGSHGGKGYHGTTMREGTHSSHAGLSHKLGAAPDAVHPKLGYK